MKLKKKIVGFLCLMFAGGMTFAQVSVPDLELPIYNFSRLLGSAGPHVTEVAGFHTLFTNPANFACLKKEWNATALSVSGQSFQSDTDTDMQYSAIGPVAFGLTNENFAFGLFNATRFNVQRESSPAYFDAMLREEVFFTGGYGAKVFNKNNHSISLGIQMKGYFQGSSVLQRMPYSSDKASEADFISYFSKNDPIMLLTGIGIDAGFVYDWNDFIQTGFVVRDAYTATFTTMYANYEDFKKSKPDGATKYRMPLPAVAFGMSIHPSLPEHFSTFTDYIFYFDYKDALSTLKNKKPAYYNIAVGMEFEFNEAYYIRLGMQELRPALGLGVDAGHFDFNMAFAMRERIKPSFAIDMSLRF